MIVSTKVGVYERDGFDVDDDVAIEVVSDERPDFVKIVVGGRTYLVRGDEMLKAIENARNVRR
jgi:hypothetical protein